jgi:hypothetical protein
LNVVEFNSGNKRKETLLELLEDLRKKVEDGEIEEIVTAAMDPGGDIEIYVGAKDLIGAVGMFSAGQHILMERGEAWSN